MSRPLTIAVADDERDTREYLQELFTRLGHHVVAAEDGPQLLELCRTRLPDVVVTDITMPGLDGLAVAAEVNRGRLVPVILVSARADAPTLARKEGDYIVSCLTKPLKAADLTAAVERAVASTAAAGARCQDS